MSAIRLIIKKGGGNKEPTASKFLGKPVLPRGWSNSFSNTVLFLLQINLEEIAEFDKENRLPHKGYLYFFLDTVDGEYDLKPIVRYYAGEPEEIVDNFNELVPGYENLTKDYYVEFEEAEDDSDGSRLLGVPNDWDYSEDPRPLLFQFDPMETGSELGLFQNIDGYFYFFLEEDEEPFRNEKVRVELAEMYS